ncbi:hypothetical protein SDC9_87755 [bioreactor metagenome]|uniref:Uncharacterized protein n=1 Tax=bioreactor metagenome TaxID=1076179 RepID=A0A644ZJN8_9ZZZZ
MVVLLGNRVLGGKPKALAGVQRVTEAGVGKGQDGGYRIELPLQHAGTVKFADGLAALGSVVASKHQLRLSGTGSLHLRSLVNVPEGMTGNGNGYLPVLHHR